MQYCCLRLTNRSEGSWKHSSRTAEPTFTVCQGPREVVQPTLFLSLCLMIISKARGAAYCWGFIIITLSLLASCDLLLEIQYGKTVLPTEQGYLLCAREREGYLLCARERERVLGVGPSSLKKLWTKNAAKQKWLHLECHAAYKPPFTNRLLPAFLAPSWTNSSGPMLLLAHIL